MRNYNLYTLFTSINIFDRYLASVGHWTLIEHEIDYLMVASCFIAAKIEQAKKPLLENLIFEYRALMHKILRRDLLNIMEKQVLIQLAFDLPTTIRSISLTGTCAFSTIKKKNRSKRFPFKSLHFTLSTSNSKNIQSPKLLHLL